MCANLM